jgi:RNA polymerase sigma factor (sigma-70 family)
MQQPALDQDHEVVARMALGDRQALSELYARYARPLLAYLRMLTPDAGLAEELLQDTLLAAWTSASRYAGHASVQGWLLGIARRRAHDTLRRRTLHLVDPAALEPLPASDLEPEAHALIQATGEELVAAIDRLPPLHQEVLLLTFVHDLSYQELTDVLGIPVGTVKSRLSNAKRALRELLRSEEASR